MLAELESTASTLVGYTMSNETMVCIVGAGIAGLAAGIYGQLNSFSTQIFEMHSLPGGLCTAWQRRGYWMAGLFDTLKRLAAVLPAMGTVRKYGKLTRQEFARRFQDPFLRDATKVASWICIPNPVRGCADACNISADLSVCGVISYYGFTDLMDLYQRTNLQQKAGLPPVPIGTNPDFAERRRLFGRLDVLLGGWPQDAPHMYPLASPSAHVHHGCPSTLLIQGHQDTFVPVDATCAH
jgi:hypothetical protein